MVGLSKLLTLAVLRWGFGQARTSHYKTAKVGWFCGGVNKTAKVCSSNLCKIVTVLLHKYDSYTVSYQN